MISTYKNIFSLVSVYSFGNIAQNAILFIFLPIYTAYVTPEEFGILALMNLIVNLGVKFITTPIIAGLNRFYYNPEYLDKSGTLLFNLFLYLFALTLLFVLIYYFSIRYISDVLFKDFKIIGIIQLYAFILLLNPVSTLFLQTIRIKKKAKSYISISLAGLLISSTIILFLLIKMELGLFAIAFGHVSKFLILTVLSIPIFIKHSKFRFDFSILKKPLKFGYPAILAGFSTLLINSGDRYILKIFNSMNVVGLYDFGYRIASIINIIIVVPLKQGLQPIIYQKESTPNEQKNVLRHGSTYFYIFTLFIALILSLFSRELITAISSNDAFISSWIIVPIVAFSYVQHGLGTFFGFGIIMKDKSSLVSFSMGTAAAINIGLNFILIPLYGLPGAAFATLISYLSWNSLKLYFSAKYYELHFELKRLFIITFISVALFFAGIFLARSNSLFKNLIIKFVLVGSYFPILYYINFFTKYEKTYINTFLRLIKTNGPVKAFLFLKQKLFQET